MLNRNNLGSGSIIFINCKDCGNKTSECDSHEVYGFRSIIASHMLSLRAHEGFIMGESKQKMLIEIKPYEKASYQIQCLYCESRISHNISLDKLSITLAAHVKLFLDTPCKCPRSFSEIMQP